MGEFYSFKAQNPKIHKSCFIAPNATLIGKLNLVRAQMFGLVVYYVEILTK